MTQGFLLETIDAAAVDRARSTGLDTSGHPVQHLESTGGEPLRCCLRNAEAGEKAILFGYEPPLPASPYREIGAVFTHAEPCDGPASVTEYPRDWYGKAQVLRAYDDRGWIHPATCVHDGSDPEGAIRKVLAEPGVVQVHSRNISYGCYNVTIRPAAEN